MEERRSSLRTVVDETGYISSSGSSTRCLVNNISGDGAALEVPDPSHLPTRFQLMTEKDRVIRNCRVVWMTRSKIGVIFE